MATKKYGFLPMDEDDWGNPQFVEKTPKKPRKVEPHVSKANRKRDAKAANFEERWGDEDVLEEKIPKTQSDFPKRMKVSHESGSMNETEEERAQRIDREEREAFVKRLSARDADTTKNLVEDRSSAASSSFSAQRRALADDAAARSAALPDLRERSRQDYLKKRETERLALLRKQVAEETEELRSGVRLSETEKADFAKNREILRIAEERLRIDDHLDGYAMPEDYITEKGKIDRKKKEDAMYKRYVDRDEYGKERYVTEHEEWEREQATKAKAQIQSTERVDQGEYDYLLDEDQGIKWLMDSTLAANGMNKEQAFLAAQLDAAEQRQKSLQETRASLPIAAYREDFLKAFEQSQILVVVGETGSGKTTQLPQYIKEAGYEGVVGCTQPRRVAAMSVAARVADEMGVKLGNEVGYSVRFENKTSQTGNHKTIIKYLTDGLLLREAFSDVLLSEYCCIMVDEAHERTVATDILMGLLKDLARGRPELKILISSATMNAQKFADYFDCDIYNIPGRTFPIRIYHTPTPEANYVQACVSTCLTIHTSQGKGDILVFLTGQEDITLVEEMLTDIARKLGNRIQELIILPLYSTLPSDLQSKVFEPTPDKARKIVLATNIAETSLTIPGVVFVIDAGLQKLSVYNPTTGLSQLIVSPTSKAAANQRAGRAGRVSEGHCFRLYTKYAFETEMDESTAPEILQTNLTSVVLLLKSLGINDILGFDWMDSPASDALIQALESLYALGALNSGGSLTKTGRRLSEMPIDIMAAKAILASGDLGCSEEVTTICAMLGEAEGLFYRPKDKKLLADSARQRFHSEAGDHFVFLNVFSAWAESGFSHIWAKENFLQIRVLNRVRDIRDQMVKINERIEVPMMSAGATNTIPIQKAVTAGFFLNTAILSGGSYRTIKSKSTVYIHPSSVMMGMEPPARVIVYGELVETTKEWMRTCMPIKAEWLMELAPHYFKKSDIEKMEPKKTQKANSALISAVKAAGPVMFR
jgi:pre-mRNA-splicing factor ATP-dependent RNA helicase DHX16